MYISYIVYIYGVCVFFLDLKWVNCICISICILIGKIKLYLYIFCR